MTIDVKIKPINETFVRIDAELCIQKEISQEYTFEVPGAKFMPLYKTGRWDGKIRLFNAASSSIGKGLVPELIKFVRSRGYSIVLDKELVAPFKEYEFRYVPDHFPLPKHIDIFDYQENAIEVCLKKKRCIILSSTSSGKSLIISLLSRIMTDKKVLIIVPRVDLVEQLYDNFIEYFGDDPTYDIESGVHKLCKGADKTIEKNVTIATWQTLQHLPNEYFKKFDVVMGDEVHEYEAKVCAGLLDKCVNAFYRWGFTGTLDDSKMSELSLKALFGPVVRVSSTKNLIERGIVSQLKIKPIILKHNLELSKLMKKAKYQDEVDFVNSLEKRNRFVVNLAKSLPNNTLVLYRYVEKHGKLMLAMTEDSDKQCFIITGGTQSDQREMIKNLCEDHSDIIIFASYALFSTGISINNLHNIILSASMKSKTKILQSIGRVLRLHESKNHATVYDIVDDFSQGKKSWENYSIKHFLIRYKLYLKEGFDVKISNIKI